MSAIYVHVPFCDHKCPFCSFAVTVAQLSKRDRYIDTIAREAERFRGARARTVYVGGGTPSCLEVSQIERLWRMIAQNFVVDENAERTFEVNPESLDQDKAQLLFDLGFERISLGVQSLNDERLAFLGRQHDRVLALKAYDMLRSVGFKNVNVDVMVGLPGRPFNEFKQDLAEILGLQSEHLSLYSLTIEAPSLFHVRKVKVDQEAQGKEYAFALKAIARAGFEQYEVSNFSKPGFASRHNVAYWRGDDYFGLGMSAHTYLSGRRSWNADRFPLYMEMIERTGKAVVGSEELRGVEKLMERFLFALRMNDGVDIKALSDEIGCEMPVDKQEAIETFTEMGLLEEVSEHVRVTDKGRMILDEISARLV